MRSNMLDFTRISGMPSVHGIIDCTHVAIAKSHSYPEDYYYFRSSKYYVVVHAVVDAKKNFIDLCVGLPGSVNDSRVLRRSHLYRAVTQRGLLNIDRSTIDNFPPYIIGNKGYPCLSWLLVPHKRDDDLTFLQRLFNRKFSKTRVVVENAFGILKLTFRELHNKTDLDINFVPDLIYACAILHNILLGEKDVDVQELLRIITMEANENLPPRRVPVHGFPQWHEHNVGLEAGELSEDPYRDRIAIFLGLNKLKGAFYF
jgi:hypothetical protein